MRTLVIGESGYIGRAIVAELKNHGDILATHHSRKTDWVPLQFTFPGADFDDLMTRTRPDLVIFAAEIEKQESDMSKAALSAFE